MRVGLIAESNGVHERRFIRAFSERGHECEFLPIGGLRASDPRPDIFFGGPLHLGSSYHQDFGEVPYVAVSYAYDILWLAERDCAARKGVEEALAASCGMLADCEKVKEYVQDTYGYPHPILVRPWGLERPLPTEESPCELSAKKRDSGMTVISARNFTAMHGVPDVIRGFGLAVSRGANLRMVVAGDGDLRREITSLVDDLGLGDRVELIGTVTEQQLQQIFRTSDIYVSASTVDGTSISLLQAMSAGLTVVLSDVGGNTEWAARIEGARLFKVGDSEQIANHLAELAASRVPMVFDRSDTLENLCDWRRNADDIANFCCELANS
jgi:glycosyltransferase involved in cell wall biosynthesis